MTLQSGLPTSPPAFNWDLWYGAIGGRKISIPEANSILQQIYEDQYQRFDGEVNPQRTDLGTPEEAAARIKAKAAEFGADICGICVLEPSDIYRGKTVTETHAIALGQRMDYTAFQTVPSESAAIECLRIYQTLGETVIALANWIRSMGYSCKVEHPIGDSDILHIPVGLKAGFGELGRHGSIIHPVLGPLFRMGSVITSMNLACDVPVDAGIAAFCDSCKACRIYCPANAIPDERDPNAGKDHLGNDRYLVDTGKCFPYFANHYYCSACLPVCVYNHKEWARDFKGNTVQPFPTIQFDRVPDVVDSVPENSKHYYPKLLRGQGPRVQEVNPKWATFGSDFS